MLLQRLDVTAGMTLAPVPAVATVPHESLSVSAPATATVRTAESLSAPILTVRSYRGAANYLTIFPLILLLTLEPPPCQSSS